MRKKHHAYFNISCSTFDISWYPSSHNLGSVKNGCISNRTYLTFRVVFHCIVTGENGTPLKTSICPENQWLEHDISVWNGPFLLGHSFIFVCGGGLFMTSTMSSPRNWGLPPLAHASMVELKFTTVGANCRSRIWVLFKKIRLLWCWPQPTGRAKSVKLWKETTFVFLFDGLAIIFVHIK